MKERSSGEPIRLGLIGCGGIVKLTHLASYLNLGELVRVVAIADPVAENRDQLGDALNIPASQRYVDHVALLEKAEVDAVTIATPHYLHARQAIQAAEAGVAIISEKPPATTMEEAYAMREAVLKHGVSYAIVHNLLHCVPMQSALAILRAGELGQPYFGRGMSLAHVGSTEHPARKWWKLQPATGGGCIADTSYHEIYSTEALMCSPVRYVEARVKTMYYPFDIDDLALTLFEHENGAISTVSTSWCVPQVGAEPGRRCEVHAPQGSLRTVNTNSEKASLQRWTLGEGWKAVELPGLADAKAQDEFKAGHVTFFEAVFEALASGKQTPTTIDTACHMMAIVEGARRASDERRAVDVQELERPS